MEIISVSNKRKKVEVTGGFYSEEDMRSELAYKQPLGRLAFVFFSWSVLYARERIDKIKLWAIARNLVR